MSNVASGEHVTSLSAFARLRDDTCETLFALDAAAKARASIVRSCSEMRGLSPAESEALRDLLLSITEQRKRMRAVRRVWQSLEDFERPSAELVQATDLCIAECREFAAAIDPWRERSIRAVHAGLARTWSRLLQTAHAFTPQPAQFAASAQQTFGASAQQAMAPAGRSVTVTPS